MSAREQLSRKFALLLAAFAAGLIVMLIGVSVLNSRLVVGVALLLLVVVGAFGYNWFRCPHCGNSILHYTVREVRAWLVGGPRQCPFCEGDLQRAAAEVPASRS